MAEETDIQASDTDLLQKYFGPVTSSAPSPTEDEDAISVPDFDISVPDFEKSTVLRPSAKPSPGFERLLPPATEMAQLKQRVEMQRYHYDGNIALGMPPSKAKEEARKQSRNAMIHSQYGEYEIDDEPVGTGVMAVGGRVFGQRRLVDVQDVPKGMSAFEARMEGVRKAEKEIRAMLDEEGTMAALGKVWGGSDPMTEEQAKNAGIGIDRQSFWGRDRQEGVDEDTSFFDDPYIPYGIKNIPELVERAAVKIGIPNMFAEVFLDEDEREAYLKETRLVLPTENFEQIVEVVETSREKGMSDGDIKDQLSQESLLPLLMMQSYEDLPSGFQMKAPSVEVFKEQVSLNPERFSKSNNNRLLEAAALIDEDATDKQIQAKLNQVSFGSLPPAVWTGSVPSTTSMLDQAIQSADRVIKAKGRAGEAARVLEKGIADALFSSEKIGDEVMVVENTFGKMMRMLGVFTEGVAEADISLGLTQEDMPESLSWFPGFSQTPASRDFYYNYGLRDIDSTWLSRALANIETGNQGFTVHLTNEARVDGKERGTSEFHAKLFVGGALDFLVPWEKLHIGPVAHSAKAAARGSSMVKKLGIKDFKGRAFLAGASPFLYNRLYNIHERATLALNRLSDRLPPSPDVDAVKRMLDQDDAAQTARAEGGQPVLNEFGNEVVPLSETERKFAESIFGRMQEGENFDQASVGIRANYTPDVFETSADVTMAVVRHIIETEEGSRLFPKGKRGTPEYQPGVLPWELEHQLERVLGAAGVRYSDVKDIIGNVTKGNEIAYLEGLRVLNKTGADADTVELRGSTQYVGFRKELEKLVKSGEMTPEQKVVLLSMMETRAYNHAAQAAVKQISEPKDFFKLATIQKVKSKLPDGSAGPDKINIRVGGKGAKKFFTDIDLDNVDTFIEILRSDDVLSMTRLFENNGALLVDLMGKDWAGRFFKHMGGEENIGRSKKMPKNRLSDDGKTQAEEMLRSVIHAQGKLGAKATKAQQLFANLTSVYARMGEDAKRVIITNPQKRGMVDQLLRPDRFFRHELIERNMKRVNRPGTMVPVSGVLEERVIEGKRATAGKKRVFADVDTNPEYVRQALGITDEIAEVDAVETVARAIGYVVAETMKREEGSKALRGMDLVNLTPATFVTRNKVKGVRSRVNSRMASILGIDKRSQFSGRKYLNAKRLGEMADSKTSTITLNDVQQARFKVFLQRLASEPFVANKIPDELLGANGKVDVISFENYNRVVELMTDVEASAYARRTVYTEAIPRSLAYSLLSAFRSETAEVVAIIPPLNDFIKEVELRFKLDDPLSDIRPELKEILLRELSKLQGVRDDVLRLVRDVRRKNPEAAIEDIFDSLRLQLEADMRLDPSQVKLLMGEIDIVNKTGSKKGILSILKEFSAVEIKRINAEFEAQATELGKAETLQTRAVEIIEGRDVIVEDEYVSTPRFKISPYESRFQFLTKKSTRTLLQDLCSVGGIDGFSEEIGTALSTLERLGSEKGLTASSVAKLSDVDRVMIADALYKIQNRLEDHARYIDSRGGTILTAMAGKTFGLPDEGILKTPEGRAQAYMYFHQGGDGWRNLYDLVGTKGGMTKLDPNKVSQYSPAQAFLEMTVRLMAEDRLMGLYDTMVKHGMPGAGENYRLPKKMISPIGAEYSVETNNFFYTRVKGYMAQIFKESGDIGEIVRAVEGESGVIVRRPDAPGTKEFPYKHAAYEPRGRPFDLEPDKFEDLDAQIAAEEALVRFGVRTRGAGQSLVDFEFPDGSVAFIPEAMAEEIKNAIVRAGGVGGAYASDAAHVLRQSVVSAPHLDVEKTPRIRTFVKTANAVEALINLFPVTATNIKRGVTTGLFIPNPAYYTANFLGGALQLFTAVDPIKGVTMLTKNPKMVGAVVSRMFKDGDYKPFGNHIIVAKNGMIYNADQIAEMAMMYRLNSSFIQAETHRSMAEDIVQYLRDNENMAQKAGRYATAWNDYLAETATALDNFYRVSIFVDQLNDGVSPSQAAGLARRAAFDYSALTDWERKYARNAIMFYSYLRKNMDLFYDTLLTNPSRVTNQLRLTNGLHQANMESDPQAVLPEYMQSRLMVGITNAVANKQSYDQRMYVMPPVPITDSLNLVLDIYDSVRGDKDAMRMLFTKLTPWFQMVAVMPLGVDPFYGQEIDRYNQVPPWLMEWDLAVTGGMLRKAFDVKPDTKRNPRLRLVEGDEDRQYYRAHNGRAWWFYRNMLQIPGTGRSMTIIDQLDRSNLGLIEGMTEMLRTMRIDAEEMGLVEEREYEFTEGDTMSPRVGFTPMDEFLGVGGIRPQLVPNIERTRELLLKEIDQTYKKKYPVATNKYEQARKKYLFDPTKLR
mgnify:CR=1 FL=1